MDKICILIPSFGIGGAEKVGLNLANYYASEGLDVDLVVILRFGGYRSLVASGVNVVDLDRKRASVEHASGQDYSIKFGGNGNQRTAAERDPTARAAPVVAGNRVGRNDPCPCGSGKKYKHCHGRA